MQISKVVEAVSLRKCRLCLRWRHRFLFIYLNLRDVVFLGFFEGFSFMRTAIRITNRATATTVIIVFVTDKSEDNTISQANEGLRGWSI